MTDLYWLQPEWKNARCSVCGINIWNDGGDPDWGYCYQHFNEYLNNRKNENRERD